MTKKQREKFIKFFAVFAIIAMLLGGVASALLVFLS